MIGLKHLDGAANKNVALRHVLKTLLEQQEQLANSLGVDVSAAPQTTRFQRIPPPPLAQMTVSVAFGLFYIIDLTNPEVDGQLIHEVQSSSTLPFSVSSDIASFGPAVQTQFIVLTDSRPTLYWRWRTRYPHSGYNVWQKLSTTVEGEVTLTSAELPTLNAKFTSPRNTPLVQDGTTKTINIYSFTARIGEISVNYNSGTVVAAEYDTYIIYVSDPNKLGGTVTYLATLDPLVAAGNDDNVIIGTITLSSLGGGMGVSFDGPLSATSGTISGTVITKADLSTKLVQNVVVGDTLLGIDGGTDTVVKVETITNRPVWTLVTDSGKTLQGACSHHLLYSSQGGPRVLDGVWPADRILVFDGAANLDDFVTSRTLISGVQTIYRIVTNRTKTYLADGIWTFDKGGALEV